MHVDDNADDSLGGGYSKIFILKADAHYYAWLYVLKREKILIWLHDEDLNKRVEWNEMWGREKIIFRCNFFFIQKVQIIFVDISDMEFMQQFFLKIYSTMEVIKFNSIFGTNVLDLWHRNSEKNLLLSNLSQFTIQIFHKFISKPRSRQTQILVVIKNLLKPKKEFNDPCPSLHS